MRDILSEIVDNKRIEVAKQKDLVSLRDIERQLMQADEIPFYYLKESLESSETGIISEFKRRSPRKGWLHEYADVNIITKEYESSGAAALSVLTDEKYFGGTLADLMSAAKNVHIPVMRKEFIIDEYQIYEAKLAGASAILLIAAAITKEE